MSTLASRITSLTIVCSTVYSGANQRKHQSCASLAFPVTGEFPAQMASNAENVSIWWRHHEIKAYLACKPTISWYWVCSTHWVKSKQIFTHAMTFSNGFFSKVNVLFWYLQTSLNFTLKVLTDNIRFFPVTDSTLNSKRKRTQWKFDTGRSFIHYMSSASFISLSNFVTKISYHNNSWPRNIDEPICGWRKTHSLLHGQCSEAEKC